MSQLTITRSFHVWLLALACLAMVAPLTAQEITWDTSLDLRSKYIWRGQPLSDDAVLHPSLTASYKGFSANVWASFDLTDINDRKTSFQEVDYTFSYSTALDNVGLTTGVIFYDFPGQDSLNPTTEVFGTVGVDVPLNPSVSVYYDFDEVNAFYVNAGLSESFELTDQFSLELGASIGWADREYNASYTSNTVKDDSMNDLLLSATLNYAVNEQVTLSAYAAYSDMVDNTISDWWDSQTAPDGTNLEGSNLIFGCGVSASF